MLKKMKIKIKLTVNTGQVMFSGEIYSDPYRQPTQNGVLTDQLLRVIYCIHLSIMPMQIALVGLPAALRPLWTSSADYRIMASFN